MTYKEITDTVMFQTNNDVEDKEEFKIALPDYVNAGYGKLCDAFWGMYPTLEGPLLPLKTDSDKPNLPLYAHRAIADYASYMMYRNGNPIKQNRGLRYLQDFNEVLSRLRKDSAKIGDKFAGDGSMLTAEQALSKPIVLKHKHVFEPLL